MIRYNFIENRSYSFNQLETQGVDHSTLVFLQKNNIVEKKNQQYIFRFIGSIFINNSHLLIHPKYRNHLFNEEEITLFHNALIKFNNTNELIDGELAGNWNDVYDILLDFKSNGYFESYKKTEKTDWSNPSWEKMMCQDPLIVNNTVYWNTPTSTATTISTEKLKMLHYHIIHFLLDTFPIMKSFFPHIIPHENSYRLDPSILSYKIKLELKNNLFTREQNILRKFLKIIKRKSGTTGLIMGTKHVHIFWEQLCKQFLNDVSYKWIQHFPRAQWNIKGKIGQAAAHKPDIIMEINDRVYLFDAKYYHTSSHQPGIQDITKQILYAKCIKKIRGNADVHNGFLFPSENPNDYFSNASGEISYTVFESDFIIKTHHQYDIELFKHY